jgi:hypothetical protein
MWNRKENITAVVSYAWYLGVCGEDGPHIWPKHVAVFLLYY